MANITQKITPFLWFDTNAEEAAKFYTSVFKDSSINSTSYYGEGAPMPKGTALTVSFTLFGEKFTALNGGPQCGWLKDKFGLSWQIVPVQLMQLLTDKDEGVRNRVMQAMMKMIKIDVPALEKAAKG